MPPFKNPATHSYDGRKNRTKKKLPAKTLFFVRDGDLWPYTPRIITHNEDVDVHDETIDVHDESIDVRDEDIDVRDESIDVHDEDI